MSKVNPTARVRRLNRRALFLLGAAALTVVVGLLGLTAYRDRDRGALFRREALKRLDQGQPQLALGYLNQYLDHNPDDLDTLDLKSKILAEGARNGPQALEAIQLHNKILGRAPDDPKRQATRRRLVVLTLKIGDRAPTAVTLARDLIARGADDAGAHRLLAQALEQVGTAGDRKALDEASREYETAARLEPADIDGAERLALLYRDLLNDPAKALRVLDALVEANHGHPDRLASAHLARSRYFAGMRQPDRASAELAAGLKADPTHVGIRLAAAEAATERGDAAEARRQLAAIPEASRGDLRVKMIEGLIELKEQHPSEAVQSWRTGLLQTGGNNADLTWRLAHVLLDMGRLDEAAPLLAQYRRLIGGDEPNEWFRYLNAFAFLKKNRPAEAIAELEPVRLKAPRALAPYVHFLLGRAYDAAHDPTKAVESYREAAVESPMWADPWLAIARDQAAERPDDAIATVEQGLAAIPGDPSLLSQLALLSWQKQVARPKALRSWSEVDAALARADKAAPRSIELALVQADYLTSLGRADDAFARLRAAAESNPRSVPLWSALANGLKRSGRASEALEVLDRAVAAAGSQAPFGVIRASILIGQDHVKEARAALLGDLGRVPAEQRPMLWKALGELYAGQGDLASARHADAEWARLRPDDPEPRIVLFELALASGDDAAIGAEVEALTAIGGPEAPYGRVARVEQILKALSGRVVDAAQLDEADRLVRAIQTSQPEQPLGFLLEGRVREKRRETDKAIAAYERALALKGGRAALGPLLSLLVREHRDADLDRLRATMASLPPELDRLATVEAIRLGDKDRAEQLAARMVQGDPKSLDARAWQARVLGATGKPEEAEKVLRLLIEQEPDEPGPWLQLLMLQVGRKQLRAASATVAEIRAKVKTDRPELLWAQCYRAAGDAAQAASCYRDALKRWPDDGTVARSAVAYFEQSGRRDEAEAVLRDVLARDPALGWATRKLALLRAGHVNDRAAWDEAIRLIGPAAKPDDTPEDRLTRAGVYARGPEPGHRRQAILILEELASEAPQSQAVHELLARLLLASGQAGRARAHALRAASADDATPDAILLYAGILLREKDLDGVEAQLGRLVALDPESLPVIELRARIALARGKDTEAVAGLERAFDSRLDTPEALAVGEKMIGLLVELGQPEASARLAHRVGALGPKGACLEAEFLARRGKLDDAARLIEAAAQAGDPAAAGSSALALAFAPGADPRWVALADRALTAASKQDPGSADLLTKLAYVRHFQHRPKEQVALYRAILDRKPGNFLFLNDMAWTLAEDLGEPDEGLKRADEALAKVGWQPNVLDTRGVILTRLGKLDEAIKDLEAAASAMPIGPVYFHLARAYQKRGRDSDYRKTRDRARDLGLRPEQLQDTERADWDAVMKP